MCSTGKDLSKLRKPSEGKMKNKIKAHLFTLPRWFAAPFFGSSIIMGVLLADGGLGLNAWLALVAGLLVMAGGHSFNSFLDYAWTGLDKGKPEDRSAEKDYTGGQNLIENRVVSISEVAGNAVMWYLLSTIPMAFIISTVGRYVAIPWILGMLVTFWYSVAKFNWTHELALGVGVGPLSVLLGMFAVNPYPPVMTGLIVSVPFAIVLSFLGLALDEWPDAEANLKKGVKSVAYKVWEYGVSLEWYVSAWLLALLVFHVFMVSIGILKPLTGIAFIPAMAIIPLLVLMKGNFRKVMRAIVAVGAIYCILLVVGQAL